MTLGQPAVVEWHYYNTPCVTPELDIASETAYVVIDFFFLKSACLQGAAVYPTKKQGTAPRID